MEKLINSVTGEKRLCICELSRAIGVLVVVVNFPAIKGWK